MGEKSITAAKSIPIRRYVERRKYEIVISESGTESLLGSVGGRMLRMWEVECPPRDGN